MCNKGLHVYLIRNSITCNMAGEKKGEVCAGSGMLIIRNASKNYLLQI